MRPTIESTIRLLLDEFDVTANTPEAVWRPMLEATEQEFIKLARNKSTGSEVGCRGTCQPLQGQRSMYSGLISIIKVFWLRSAFASQ